LSLFQSILAVRGTLARHRCYEAISSAGHRLHEPRLGGIVAEREANFSNCGINGIFRIKVNVFAPQFLDNLFPRHQLPYVFCEQQQKFHWNPL
jgi:hypothetical protein